MSRRRRLSYGALLVALIVCRVATPTAAQTLASLQGQVFDPSGAFVAGAAIRVQHESTRFDVRAVTDTEGRYYLAAIPAGTYSVTADAAGFRTERIDTLNVDVGRRLVRDFHLSVGSAAEFVAVSAEVSLVDRATNALSHVVTTETVQQIPLNGRHFIDLSLQVPGSVAPSQAGFSSRPIRGVGALAFNIAGNREEAVSFLVNGVSTNNLTFGSLIFEPPLTSIQEFKVDSSTFSAEQG
ncbi:MAG TPA: carboxypeptidase-like regulatory domain-containing protein, partial [Vicinamibacterales bacterium]